MSEKEESIYPWVEGSEKDPTDLYDGFMANASSRTFLDIEPNISVRPEFNRKDYYAFRMGESPSGKAKIRIKNCMKAYDNVGIIKNVIDLMGDFASRGITINHPKPGVQKFFRRWWEKVNGSERSERFLNNLYRCGNVIVYKRKAKMNPKARRDFSRSSDLKIENPKFKRAEIPFKYNFLNPLMIEAKGGALSLFKDSLEYQIKLSNELKKQFKDSDKDLSPKIKKALQSGENYVDLDPDKVDVFFYKKDDWDLWAAPMINSIIDDITMLEKMKLADMSALDGAISNIRLWRVGSLEHKITPNRATITRLRNILASNVGGGTMDLIWGPELDFKESNTQIYKFLGNEKYNPVLNSIYAGLGIPPTLTGLAGQSGGYTNNFISLKTLIERLEYGRELLCEFWKSELEEVQKSLGIKQSPELHFDFMILSDEAAQKNLLMNLADRDVISIETLRERLGEMNEIENARISKEYSLRDKEKMAPKTGPFHPPQQEDEQPNTEDNGRPKFKKDTLKRKKKAVQPKSKPNQKEQANMMVWALSAVRSIGNTALPFLLEYFGKKNLRTLSKAEARKMEEFKLQALCGLDPYSDISPKTIADSLDTQTQFYEECRTKWKNLKSDLRQEIGDEISVDDARNLMAIAYCHCRLSKS